MNAAILSSTGTSCVDGMSVPLTSFCMPSTNYGQPEKHLKSGSYEIQLSLEVFVAVLSRRFEQFAREMKADEATDPTHDGFPELGAYQQLGYPDLRVMLLQEPRLLERLVREWMEMSLLEELSTADTSPKFAFNSLESVSISDSRVILRGSVLKAL